ncbi:leucine-rich repeat receptor-like serine/threonine-protein kinase [Dorcoceras hygrometricum]|uniref:Leucine-rich repeat receptor-like serine/threonine-protein kinase n=1 Tax=Dorcoceras hygrometricum TaxID=472368 RepID=A0A2Z7CB00_9LAMI|nr:leucine-rich repeat receptor-like serine/threonine-protein kinase [Dorcoceras hygrometricum]
MQMDSDLVIYRTTLVRTFQVLLFTEPYLLRLPMVDSSDESESGSVGLLLLRRFVWILFSNVCLKLVVDLRHCGNLLVVIVAQRIELEVPQEVDRVSQLAYSIYVLVLLAGECPVLVGLCYPL